MNVSGRGANDGGAATHDRSWHSCFLNLHRRDYLRMAARQTINTAQLLTSFETCSRKGYWQQEWRWHRLEPNEALRQALAAGLTETVRPDYGEVAGETIMGLAADPGLNLNTPRLYDAVVHHACLADVLTSAIRRPGAPAWGFPPIMPWRGLQWASSAFLDPSGARLRSLVLATSWNEERRIAEERSWYSLGERAIYNLPMTLVVLILGRLHDGMRQSAWTQGFLHPINSQLRFRKRTNVRFSTFSDKWDPVRRQDHKKITTEEWLRAMLEDDILRDLCFTVELPKPEPELRQRVLDMAVRKVERLAKWNRPPEPSLSVCDRPRCPFKSCCWSETPFEPSASRGFVPVTDLTTEADSPEPIIAKA